MSEDGIPANGTSVRIRRDRLLAWIVPVVLVLVALNQLYLAQTRDLTPWKGGGFGMFASVDRLTFRAVHGTFLTDEGGIPFDVHGVAELGDYERRAFVNARALLDERRGERLADVVAHGEWRVEDGVAEFHDWLIFGQPGPVVRTPGDGDVLRTLEVEAIVLEVWRATYDREEASLVPEVAGTVRYEVGGDR